MGLKSEEAFNFTEGYCKEITKEELEIFICSSLDLYDENLVLIRGNEEPKVFTKDMIDELFEIIDKESILKLGYINESEEEIKILLTTGDEFVIEIV